MPWSKGKVSFMDAIILTIVFGVVGLVVVILDAFLAAVLVRTLRGNN